MPAQGRMARRTVSLQVLRIVVDAANDDHLLDAPVMKSSPVSSRNRDRRCEASAHRLPSMRAQKVAVVALAFCQ